MAMEVANLLAAEILQRGWLSLARFGPDDSIAGWLIPVDTSVSPHDELDSHVT
ncbi:MAG: hypothetical protein OSA98_14000 [Rubripirellula sp.]|nr:hypothetical protein [Rubripirellula sp.]